MDIYRVMIISSYMTLIFSMFCAKTIDPENEIEYWLTCWACIAIMLISNING